MSQNAAHDDDYGDDDDYDDRRSVVFGSMGGGSENKQCVRPSRPTPGLRITGTTAVRGGVYFAPVRAGLALAEIGAIFQDGGNKRRLIHGTKVFW